jgi:hypothetical protein
LHFSLDVLCSAADLAAQDIAFSLGRGEVNDEYFETYLRRIFIAGCTASAFTDRKYQYGTGQQWTAADEE